MPAHRASAANHRELLEKIDQFLTSDHVASVAVNSGGSSYVVGDILTVNGGTVVGSMAARIEVTSVASGVIDGVRVLDAGAYSADPSLTANAVTGGSGSSATLDLTMLVAQWTQRIANISSATSKVVAISGSIGTAGSGYAVDDVVTMVDSISSVAKAQFRVTAVGVSGEVLTINLEYEGDYNSSAGGAFATTGGSGSGLTINPETIPVRDEYLWEGEGTGGNEVYVGMRTGYAVSEDQVLAELAGFTGYSGGSDWEAQPGISPGRNDLTNDDGCAMLLSTSTIPFWVVADARRIIVVANVDSSYQSAFLGLLDPYGTDTEIPYPLFICGSSSGFHEDIGSNSIHVRSIADPTKDLNHVNGPGMFRESGGSWVQVCNGNYDNVDIANVGSQPYFVYPCGQLNSSGISDEDFLASTTGDTEFQELIPDTRTGNPIARMQPMPDSGGDIYCPIQCVLIRSNGATTHRVLGQLPGVFWVAAEGGLATEDRIITASGYYTVFQMGSHSLAFAHFCILES